MSNVIFRMVVHLLYSYPCRMFARIAEAAKALNVSERFLRQLIATNQIPFYRLSARTLRVDLVELRTVMLERAQKDSDRGE